MSVSHVFCSASMKVRDLGIQSLTFTVLRLDLTMLHKAVLRVVVSPNSRVRTIQSIRIATLGVVARTSIRLIYSLLVQAREWIEVVMQSYSPVII